MLRILSICVKEELRMGKEEITGILARKSVREIWLDVEDLLDSSFTIDELLELGEPYGGYFEDDCERLLSLGATPTKLFKINEHWYKQMVYQPKELAPHLMVYVKYGIDPEYIKKWIRNNVQKSFIVKYADDFRALGLQPEKYVKAYFEWHSIRTVWDNLVFKKSPSIIKPDDIIGYYSIKDIESLFDDKPYSGCEGFIKEFIKAGGSVKKIAKKYLDACGYPEDEFRLCILATLSCYGANIIDPNKLIDALTYKAYIYKDQASIGAVNAYILEKLEGRADDAHLAKLR